MKFHTNFSFLKDKKVMQPHHKNYLRYKVPFLNVVKFSWKLQFDHVIFFGFSQACPKCSEKIINTDFDGRFGPSM